LFSPLSLIAAVFSAVGIRIFVVVASPVAVASIEAHLQKLSCDDTFSTKLILKAENIKFWHLKFFWYIL
jgi:hypothetical protein